MERFELLKDLLLFNKPIEVLANDLAKLSWDYEGSPFIVCSEQLKKILLRYLAAELSTKELEDWANVVECREDLDFEMQKKAIMEDIIYCLANPRLEGPITHDKCKAMLSSLAY